MSEQVPIKEQVFEILHTTAGAHGNRVAHDGFVYRCRHCGKRSHDRYGMVPIDRGFDESCMLNSVLEAA